MKDFSIVLPSRGNKDDLRKMLDSLERTTRKKSNLEFLIALDPKSNDVVEFIEKQRYSFDIMCFERPVTDDFTNDYYNWLSNRSVGRNIMAFNDDAWMRTQDWDKKVKRAIDEFGVSIYMVDVLDSARLKYKNVFPCFPMVSRRAMCTLGFLLSPEVRMYPADKLTHTIYSKVNRIIPVRDVLIEHEHIDELDGSKSRMMRIFKEDREKNGGVADLSEHVGKLVFAGNDESRKRPNKIKRIIKIIKEK